MGFSQDKEIMKVVKKAYEVDFKVLAPTDIHAQQDEQVNEVASILSQPAEATAVLLRHQRWNKEKLIENYMENSNELLEAAGLGPDSVQTPKTKVIKGFACEICCEDEPGMETYAMKCGHRYCVDCYRQYLASKIKDEGEAARIQCPTRGCNRIVDSKTLNFLVADDLKHRYVHTLALSCLC
jgi:ariadne-1